MTQEMVPQVALPTGNHFNALPPQAGWMPDQRNAAQEIIPGLWIGPLGKLRCPDFLDHNHIRVLISLTDVHIIPAIVKYKYELSPDFECHTFDPGHKVTNPMAIVSQLFEICGVIQSAQDRGVAALLFCESGNESCAIVAASYLIFAGGLDMMEAIQLVRSCRCSISLDDFAMHNLQTFQDLCRAHKTTTVTDHVKCARSREEDEIDLAKAGTLGTHKRQVR